MKRIDVDEEVFSYLQSKAIPFVENPNMTIRRLLKIGYSEPRNNRNLKRKPKVELDILVQNGLVKNGEKLYLHDYRQSKLSECVATVQNGRLSFNNKLYSMSRLAKELLNKAGYKIKEIQGPAHWYNESGISIKEIWDQYLKRQLNQQ